MGIGRDWNGGEAGGAAAVHAAGEGRDVRHGTGLPRSRSGQRKLLAARFPVCCWGRNRRDAMLRRAAPPLRLYVLPSCPPGVHENIKPLLFSSAASSPCVPLQQHNDLSPLHSSPTPPPAAPNPPVPACHWTFKVIYAGLYSFPNGPPGTARHEHGLGTARARSRHGTSTV